MAEVWRARNVKLLAASRAASEIGLFFGMPDIRCREAIVAAKEGDALLPTI